MKKEDQEVDEILDGLTGKNGFMIGTSYHIRTVTDHWIGRVVSVDEKFVNLDKCSWIPQTGRFNEFVSGKITPAEVEYIGEYSVKMDVIAGKLVWKNPLPTSSK